MVSDADIQALEDIIIEHAGPLGKFVVKKAIADMGGDPTSFNEDKIERFLDMVLERSIFDNTRWPSVRREILQTWQGGGADV